MLNKTKCFISGVIFTLVLICVVTANTDDIFKEISVIYDNIKIVINGKEIHATDVTGKEIDPFIYDGTTYVPIRAISEAFGMNVAWLDGEKKVWISEKNIQTPNKEKLANIELWSCNKYDFAIYQNEIIMNTYKCYNYEMGDYDYLPVTSFYMTDEETEALIKAASAAYDEMVNKEYSEDGGRYATFTGKQPDSYIYLWLKGMKENEHLFTGHVFKEITDEKTGEKSYEHTEKVKELISLLREITDLDLAHKELVD